MVDNSGMVLLQALRPRIAQMACCGGRRITSLVLQNILIQCVFIHNIVKPMLFCYIYNATVTQIIYFSSQLRQNMMREKSLSWTPFATSSICQSTSLLISLIMASVFSLIALTYQLIHENTLTLCQTV